MSGDLGVNLENLGHQPGVSINLFFSLKKNNKSSIVLVSAVLIALVIGGAVGYVARSGEVSGLMSSNTMMHNELQSTRVQRFR